MPDISKIKINDATYDIKDKTARESINSLSTDTQNISEGVNDIKSRIGSSSDASVGTSGDVPQTIFAGIKGILEWFTSHWTSARAAKIDNLDAKISTCAKASDWTSTRAGLIDTINTNAAAAKTDAAEAKNNTATNNTGSKTGILSQKLSYIIVNLLESTSYGLNAIKTTLNTVNTNTSRGAIRQIIYGAFSTNTDNDPITISVSLTNYKKAFVILDGQMYGTNGNLPTPYLSSISNTAIKISVKNSNYSSALTIKGSYQIVEYY